MLGEAEAVGVGVEGKPTRHASISHSSARWNPTELTLDPERTHHALHVLRMKAGDRARSAMARGVEPRWNLRSMDKEQ